MINITCGGKWLISVFMDATFALLLKNFGEGTTFGSYCLAFCCDIV